MKKIILLGLLIILVASCEQSKKYEYVEIGLKENFSGGTERDEKDGVTIRAKTDSIAYLEAYQKFCIAEKVAKDMKEAIGSSGTTPIEFKLLDDQGNDISLLINFDNIDSLKNDIRTRIFDLKNSLAESVEKNKENELTNIKNSSKIDSSKINELDKYFVIKKDEFDPNGLVWHKPKSAPKYTNQNGIYCYFQSNNGMPSNLRMRLQYEADDWLFFEKVQFSIDDKAYEFIPRDTETDSGNGGRIWEWFDQSMGSSNTELLNALANAKSAKMKLIGRQYYKIKNISTDQIKNIKRTLELYEAMGGTY
jgi:hypothetical protein